MNDTEQDQFLIEKLMAAKWIEKSHRSNETLMLQFTPEGLEKIKEVRSLIGELKAFGMEPNLFLRLFLILQIACVVRPDSENRIFLGGKLQSSTHSEEELEG